MESEKNRKEDKDSVEKCFYGKLAIFTFTK
jgi:hypothetical protein